MNIIPGQPILSAVIIFIALVAVLYLGRKSAHHVITSLVRAIYSGMRLGARSLGIAEKKLRERNKEVLLELGRDQIERQIEREFFRVNAVVERDLGGYPVLQRTMSDQIARIEDDYKESGQVPPPPPDWIHAVEAVAKLHIEGKGGGVAAEILDNIHQASVKQQKMAIKEYRASSKARHNILQAMRPYWRKLSNTVDEVNHTIKRLIERATDIDGKMDQYEEIRRGTEKAERTLRASAFTQFAISFIVVAIAAAGALINFNLIALPMSEMVGAANRIAGHRVSDIAALVIIFVEISMGLYLMEALRFTRLFPIIGAMDDKLRMRMIWITFGILFSLACMESALAFMRDQIAADLSALRASLSQSSGAQAVVVNKWIPMVGQMIMGFILPFALTFVAIPLESLVNSVRTVIGELLVLFIRSLAFLMRLVGNIFLHAGKLINNVFDLLIFLPLWIEGLFSGTSGSKAKESQQLQITPITGDMEEVAR